MYVYKYVRCIYIAIHARCVDELRELCRVNQVRGYESLDRKIDVCI